MRAALFDFDGVLVDSEPLHYKALRESLQPEGVTIDEEEYRRHYLAYDDRESIRIALEQHGKAYDPAVVQTVAERKARLFQEQIQGIPLYPGALELVRSLSREVPLAIASGALRGEIEAILSALGLRDAFRAVVGAEDVSSGKPHPEPYLAAIARLAPFAPSLAPNQCLVFEDSMAGIASALAAGMKVVGVAHTYPRSRLSAAHLVVESLEAVTLADVRSLFPPC